MEKWTIIKPEKIIFKTLNKLENTEIIDNTSCELLSADDIIKIDPGTVNTRYLVDNIYYIVSFLSEFLLGENESIPIDKIKYIISILNWISDSCFFLSKKISQNEIPVSELSDNRIPPIERSSYNFCEYSEKCTRMYETDGGNCAKHHFVYNLIKHDTDSLTRYLKYIVQEDKTISTTEWGSIMSSVKTLSYVISHINKEMENICAMYGDSYETKHKDNPLSYLRKLKLNKTNDGYWSKPVINTKPRQLNDLNNKDIEIKNKFNILRDD